MHCARTFDQGNATAPLVYVAHIPNGKFAGQTLELEQISEADTEVYAWMQEVRLLGHLVFLGQWIDCQKPETPINPKYSGDEFTSTQPTISETVPLTPPFARRLENKLMTLGTNKQKKGGQHIHRQTVC